MCLFFAINTASKYEYQKSETEIHRNKVMELEEKVNELSLINQELMQMRSALVIEKEQMSKENNALLEKHSESDDWKLTNKKEKDWHAPQCYTHRFRNVNAPWKPCKNS